MLEILLHGANVPEARPAPVPPPSRVMLTMPLSLPVQSSAGERGDGSIAVMVP